MDFWFLGLNRYLWTHQPVPWLHGSWQAASGGSVPTRRTTWVRVPPRTQALAPLLTQSSHRPEARKALPSPADNPPDCQVALV